MAVAFLPQIAYATGDVEINARNFPDENFRNYLLEQDYGKDGKLTEDEIENITSLSIMSEEINSLQGIEYFIKLIRLDCSSNYLTSLDISKNVALTYLDCSRNQLTVLDVSKNTKLEQLWCNKNQLTTLDVSRNTILQSLYCHNNQLTALDVSGYRIFRLRCEDNQLTTLNASNVGYLYCNDNQLTDLNISGCSEVYCQNNQLTDLVISGDTGMDIRVLWCYNNQLTTLDVSECTKLRQLKCFNNQLTTLNISGCTGLEELSCYNNQIKGEAMDNLINSLPTHDTEPIWGLTIYIYILQTHQTRETYVPRNKFRLRKKKDGKFLMAITQNMKEVTTYLQSSMVS